MYDLCIRKSAKKVLENVGASVRIRILEKIRVLIEDPDDQSLDVRPLVGSVYSRLRVGKWRIIFDRKDDIKIISVEKIKPRGDVYK